MPNMRPRTCKECNVVFQGGPRAWYCPNCRVKIERERAAGYRRNGPSRHIGDIDTCERCQESYIIAGGGQRYCTKCAPEAIREIDKVQGLEWYHKNAAVYNSKRNPSRRKGLVVCIVCDTPFACDGTVRNVCSVECESIRRRRWQQKADKKRSPRKKAGKS